jgi:type I restriction enzyme, R subunit
VQAHLASLGFVLQTLIDAAAGEASNQALLDAQRALCRDETGKKTFQVLAEDMQDRYRGLFPNPALFEYDPQERAISAIYNLLQKPKPKVDISAIMEDLRGIIDVMVETVPQNLAEQKRSQYDLSGIDFERLRVEFAKSPYKDTAMRTLQERIAARLAQMLHDNPGRVDLYARYQKIISEYNRDKDHAEIERMFDSLLDLHSTLDHEQARFTREGLRSEKELAVFDLLSKDKADLSKNDIAKIKAVAMALMANISERQAQMIRLQDRASAQAQIRNLIIKQMLEGMPEGFSSDEIELRASWVYQHLGNTAQATVLH